MSDERGMIPTTISIRPRPLWGRCLHRQLGLKPGPPTDQEKHDAIRVLEGGKQDALYIEAERMLAEWGE